MTPEKAEKVTLEATIEQETALIGSLTAKTEELAGNIATDNADLKAMWGVPRTADSSVS